MEQTLGQPMAWLQPKDRLLARPMLRFDVQRLEGALCGVEQPGCRPFRMRIVACDMMHMQHTKRGEQAKVLRRSVRKAACAVGDLEEDVSELCRVNL